MVDAVSLTWAHISECQFSAWIIWIHAMYICTSVLPPHCRALSMIMRMGRPPRRCSSSIDSTLRCGRLSLNGTSFPESLSLIFTHRAAQYSKSVAMRCVSVIADGLRGSGAGVSRTVFLRTFSASISVVNSFISTQFLWIFLAIAGKKSNFAL